jgi:hypothetical protein
VDDRAALLDLSIRYATAADSRDGDAFAELFEPEGELMVPAYPDELRPVVRRSGQAALRRIPKALEGYVATFHQISNPSFRIEGDDAEGTVQCVAHHLSGEPGGEGAIDFVWFIRYEDSYRRRDGLWRFGRRVLHLQWVEQHRVDRVGLPWADPGGSGGAGRDETGDGNRDGELAQDG